MVFDAVSIDEKMDSSSESSGFASAVSIMNRLRVTPVSLQTSLKMGAVGATRSRVAACVFVLFRGGCVVSGRGGGALDGRNAVLLFDVSFSTSDATAWRCAAAAAEPPRRRARRMRFWTQLRTLSGALPLLRAVTPFGTSAVHWPARHKATRTRCMVSQLPNPILAIAL